MADYNLLLQNLPRYDTRPPDIMGSFQRGAEMRESRARMAESERQRQAEAELRKLFAQPGADPASKEFQAQAMRIDPQTGMKLQSDAQSLQANNLKLQKAQHDLADDDRDLMLEGAASIWSQYQALPPEQQTPEALKGIHGQFSGFIRQSRPDLADKIDQAGDPSPEHLQALANFYQQRQAAKAAGRGGLGGAPKLHSVETVTGDDGKPKLIGIGSDFSKHELGYSPWNAGKTMTGAGGQIYLINGQGVQPLNVPGAEGQPPKPLVAGDWQQKRQEQMAGLRKEFEGLQEIKNYKEIVPILQSARDAVGRDTKAADLNLVYAAAKVMDPGSVVRESESQMWVNAGSPAERFQGLFNSILGGGRLTPEQRKEMMAEIESRAQSFEAQYKNTRANREGIAKAMGFAPEETFLGADTSPFERRRYKGQLYESGQVVELKGKRYRVTRFDPATGQPLMQEVQ